MEIKQHQTGVTEREVHHGRLDCWNSLPAGSFQATGQKVKALPEPSGLSELRSQSQCLRRQRRLEFGGQSTIKAGAK